MELGSRGKLKEVSKIVPYTESGLGFKFFVRTDKKKGFDEKGSITDSFENEIQIDENAHLFEFRIAGSGIGGLTEVIGFDILTPELTESIKK
jgi:hypothetical protein